MGMNIIIRKCKHCKKKLKTTRQRIEDGRGIYCSKKCMYNGRIRPCGLKYIKHKDNPTSFKKGNIPWCTGTKGILKANRTSFKKGQHISPETEFKYKNGKGYRDIMIKDEYINCKKCNKIFKKSRIHVHHIDYDRNNNAKSNLILFCRPCHLKEHGRIERHYVEGRKICQL